MRALSCSRHHRHLLCARNSDDAFGDVRLRVRLLLVPSPVVFRLSLRRTRRWLQVHAACGLRWFRDLSPPTHSLAPNWSWRRCDAYNGEESKTRCRNFSFISSDGAFGGSL